MKLFLTTFVMVTMWMTTEVAAPYLTHRPPSVKRVALITIEIPKEPEKPWWKK